MTETASDGEHRLRVRYCETDQMGVAHHGSYIDWFEEARTEWMRTRGMSYRDMEKQGVLLQVVAVAVEYMKPTHYDDELLIKTRVIERRRASITLGYEVFVAGEPRPCSRGSTRLACVGREGRVRRLPQAL